MTILSIRQIRSWSNEVLYLLYTYEQSLKIPDIIIIEAMNDERLYQASLKVASAIMMGLAAALLIAIPLTRTWESLTYTTLFCILTTTIAIQIERYLLE
jgi:hypothetical protein